MLRTTDPFGAIDAGSVTVTLCRAPELSGIALKLALAPATVTVLIVAFELIRKVNCVPVPRPTLVAATFATVLRSRSTGCTFAVISKLVICHAALASSCAATGYARSKSARIVDVKEKVLFIFGMFRRLQPE